MKSVSTSRQGRSYFPGAHESNPGADGAPHASATSCIEGLPQNLLERFHAHRMFPCIETIQQYLVMSNDLIERKRLGVCR